MKWVDNGERMHLIEFREAMHRKREEILNLNLIRHKWRFCRVMDTVYQGRSRED